MPPACWKYVNWVISIPSIHTSQPRPHAPRLGLSQLSSTKRMSCCSGSMPIATRERRYTSWLSACGGLSSSALDGNVEKAIVAQQNGLDDVKAVDCNDQAPPADSLPGGTGSVHAEHTCTITFSDGHPTQVWAVHVLDLEVSH